MKKKSPASQTIFYILLIAVIVVILFPYIWMVLASFKVQRDIQDIEKLFNFVPTLQNYKDVFTKYTLIKPLFNSLIIALFSTLLAQIIGLPAAYSIARYKLHKVSMIILVTRIIPGLTFLVPWFIVFASLKMTDTHFSLILTHLLVTLPLVIWIMIPYFEAMPKSLEESAKVDGSTIQYAFWKIVLPLSAPGIIASTILSFIFSWNNFMFALVLAGRRTKTLPVAIFSFLEYASVNWGGLMAASVVITLPIILISFILQKYIVRGLTAGAVKE